MVKWSEKETLVYSVSLFRKATKLVLFQIFSKTSLLETDDIWQRMDLTCLFVISPLNDIFSYLQWISSARNLSALNFVWSNIR